MLVGAVGGGGLALQRGFEGHDSSRTILGIRTLDVVRAPCGIAITAEDFPVLCDLGRPTHLHRWLSKLHFLIEAVLLIWGVQDIQ